MLNVAGFLRIRRRPGLLCVWCCSVARGHWARQSFAVDLLGAFGNPNQMWPDLLCSFVMFCRQSWICIPLTVLWPRLPNSPHATKTKSTFRHGFVSGSTLSKPFAYLGNRRAACNCIWIPREAGSGSLMYHLTSCCSLLFCSLLCFSCINDCLESY